MYLKRLELSGFKSFAKPTVLHFPSNVTAIVGPNGSGKSNCAEAMRWVLGEQSMKMLRSKKSEDLIFAGSATQPRLSKASVTFVFDNSSRQFQIEFDEVAIGRRLYRDGANEYVLNGSVVRLKDIAELLAGVGIGQSQHNIISQGDSDRILYVSASERKEMIEEALGLKVYHLKYQEADRKLRRTEENIRQVEALRKEIQPHLKFLKNQADKFEHASEIKRELEEKYKIYLNNESAFLKTEEELVNAKRLIPQAELKVIEDKQVELKGTLELKSAKKNKLVVLELENAKKELILLRDQRSRLEREMGKLEGLLEAEKTRQVADEEETVPREEVEQFLGEIEEMLSSILEESFIDQVYSYANEAIGRITSFVTGLGEVSEHREDLKRLGELNREKERASEALSKIYAEEQLLFRKEKELGADAYESERTLRELERELYECEVAVNKSKDALRSIEIDEARLRLRKEELEREKEEAKHYFGHLQIKAEGEIFSSEDRTRLLKEIDRLKFRFEESGGVDPGVLKEYKDIEERDNFFAREISDLKKASDDLRGLSADLLEKLEEDFGRGIQKINKEFNSFFGAMFSGGRAGIEILRPKKSAYKNQDELNEESDAYHHEIKEEEGIDIKIVLPKKKIKGLEMLSGGERALTSIALLFALSSVNPPPFMVLDEIDAALDEANSRRYGEMLKNLADDTQLIIITHNRESMKQASILYGVTMGSDGISKLLSLKLEEAAEYTNR